MGGGGGDQSVGREAKFVKCESDSLCLPILHHTPTLYLYPPPSTYICYTLILHPPPRPAGLDPSSYRSSAPKEEDADGGIDDMGQNGGVIDYFEDTEGLSIRCGKCGVSVIFDGTKV